MSTTKNNAPGISAGDNAACSKESGGSGGRRELIALLGGAIGALALGGCAQTGESDDDNPPALGSIGTTTQELSGTATVLYADIISDLRALSGATTKFAILKGGNAISDGGGGTFIWSTTALPDDGWNILNAGSGNTAGWRRIGQQVVSSVVNLRALPGSTGAVAILLGYSTAGDGGGGVFCWSTTAQQDNGGTIFNASSGNSAGWRRQYSGALSIRWFGAMGNSSGPPDTSAIQNALNAAGSGIGGPVFIPPGNYVVDSPLTLPRSVVLQGAGRYLVGSGFSSGSAITVKHSGVALVAGTVVGGAVPGNNRIQDLSLIPGSGFTPLAAIQLISIGESSIEDCNFGAFQYGVVLDGAQICVVARCNFATSIGGVYLTNGDAWTTGQQSGTTNVNVIRDCEFDLGMYGIIDDGGICLTVSNCNFNAQTTHCMRVAGRALLSVSGCDMESAAVQLTQGTYRSSGVVTGQSDQIVFTENSSLRLAIDTVARIECYRNIFSSPAITGANGAYRITARNNTGLTLSTWPSTGALDATGGPDGVRIQYGTAPPSGTWAVGDIVWNTNPVAGGNLGWVHTAAGWKTFGNIST